MALQGPVGQTVACPCNPGPPVRASLVLQDRKEPPGQTWCLLFPWIPLSRWPSSYPHQYRHHPPATPTHTHTLLKHFHTSPLPPPRRDGHSVIPPHPRPPEHRMLPARLRRADKADALGNSARALGPFFFLLERDWSIPGLEVARKWK